MSLDNMQKIQGLVLPPLPYTGRGKKSNHLSLVKIRKVQAPMSKERFGVYVKSDDFFFFN